MEEVQEVQLHIQATEEDKEANLPEESSVPNEQVVPVHRSRSFRRWIRIVMHASLVLSGQTSATLLGRLYFSKGGNSNMLATLISLAGFPVLLPYYFAPQRRENRETIQTTQPSFFILASVYVSIGLLVAVISYMYSVGLKDLPVSTYSLILASQLAFNALFSYFLNKQKLTPFILNSLVILTISSTLLVFQNDDSSNTTVSKAKYAIGFICTIAASAGYGLTLSLQQFAFRKIIKKETFSAILDMVIYPSLVSSSALLIGLFASRDWKNLTREMHEFELGKVSYVMTLVWSAISWQIFNIGSVGLILEASSLLSNAISVVGLPFIPILAVVFFHEKMNGLKVISLLLAIWGFLSFVYQDYIDERHRSKADNTTTVVVPSASSTVNQ